MSSGIWLDTTACVKSAWNVLYFITLGSSHLFSSQRIRAHQIVTSTCHDGAFAKSCIRNYHFFEPFSVLASSWASDGFWL